jgi:Type IV secretion-system coupling protein DNA-binding domain
MHGPLVIRFARVDFRNDNRIFGIKPEDRFAHLYIIGKTGTGKSTLLETMAIQDMEAGNGFALIDPHGDLVERIATRVPESRRADVIYFNAADPSQPYGYNPLRHVSEHRIALAASGMMEVFKRCGLRPGAFAWSTFCATSLWQLLEVPDAMLHMYSG